MINNTNYVPKDRPPVNIYDDGNIPDVDLPQNTEPLKPLPEAAKPREIYPEVPMIQNDELPIGFTMELAQHSDILNRFSGLSEPEQTQIIDGARQVRSRDEMRNYVESMFS